MGNFLDDIYEAKAETISKKERAINDIINHFQGELNRPDFEDRLKKDIIRSIKTNSKTYIHIQYWKHHDGCSETHYGMSYCKRFHGNESYDNNYYNGVDLWAIRYEVVSGLCKLYEDKLHSLGLRYSKENKTSWLDYPEYVYEILV